MYRRVSRFIIMENEKEKTGWKIGWQCELVNERKKKKFSTIYSRITFRIHMAYFEL